MATTSSANPRWFPHPKLGRRPQNVRKIPFKDEWPLILKNQVSTRRGREKEAECLKETLAFLTCLKNRNNSHELCLKEGEMVQKCFSNHLAKIQTGEKETLRAFEPGKSVKDMKPEQLNKFLAHFPHKLR